MFVYNKKKFKRNVRLSDTAPERRKRIAGRGVKFLIVVVVGVIAAVFGYNVRAELLSTPVLAVDKVTLIGAKRVKDGEVVELGGLYAGQNILTINVDGVEAAIASHSYVESANVRRVFPSTIEVRITEHVPALLVKAGELYVMDSSGALFKKYANDDALDLPVVTGFESRPESFAAAAPRLLELLGALAASRSIKPEMVSEIHSDPVYGFTVLVLNDAVKLEFGSDGFAEKTELLDKVIETRGKTFVGIESIDLNNKRGAVVKSAIAAA
ncbi:MAG: FtsQ-type POTRA domain-containing protein [Deltaproteobacteria bacterium]|nr:FtsQ-type POTRA domain-containing protein [Deltaproteobacteria bacterium]